MCSRGGGIHYFDESNDEVGTVLYYDTTDYKLHQKHYTQWNPSWKGDSIHIPIAIQVIPKSHLGSARWVSVHGVDDTGGVSNSDIQMEYSTNTQQLSGICTNCKTVPVYNERGGIEFATSGFLPTSYASGTVPSPYINREDRNEDYWKTDGTNPNPLLDFNGGDNTYRVAESFGSTGFPAIRACKYYSTSGTRAGDWYLPACGELAYLCVRYMEVMRAMFRIGCTHYREDSKYHEAKASRQPERGEDVYGYWKIPIDTYGEGVYAKCERGEVAEPSRAVYLYAEPTKSVIDGMIYSRFWTSTPFGSKTAWSINLGSGKVNALTKTNTLYVRPFIAGNLNESTGKLE